MSRPALEVADILHAQGDAFLDQHPWLSVQQRSVLRAITRCRTAKPPECAHADTVEPGS